MVISKSGFKPTTFKSDLNTPPIPTNNIICSIDDANRNI